MEVDMSDDTKPQSQNSNARRQRFIRIAESRVNKVLNNLDNLARCSNSRNYEYSEAEVKKIFREIERKVKEVKFQFQGKPESKQRFRL